MLVLNDFLRIYYWCKTIIFLETNISYFCSKKHRTVKQTGDKAIALLLGLLVNK